MLHNGYEFRVLRIFSDLHVHDREIGAPSSIDNISFSNEFFSFLIQF